MKLQFIFYLALLFFSEILLAKPIKIVFINPGFASKNVTGNFWFNVNNIMSAAADDLSINLITYFANRDHIYMKSLVDKAIIERPKYLILVNEKGMGPAMLNRLKAHNIQVFFLLNKLNEQERDLLTPPQLRNLIGSIEPDNFQAGYKLAVHLIKQGKLQLKNAHLNLLALQGDYATSAATSREQGLLKALELHHTGVTLIDSSVANWSKTLGYAKTKGILAHQHNINIVWCANDAIAFGAKAAINDLSIKHQVLVGGINWDNDSEGYKADISYGGHVLLGAKAIIMIHDFAHKLIKHHEMTLTMDIFQANTHTDSLEIIKLINRQNIHQVNFKHFSKIQNNNHKFTIENLVKSAKGSLN